MILTQLERCFGDLHRWPPYVGDPVAESFWIGQQCYCGEKVWAQHKCECGHEHLMMMPTTLKPEPMFGTHIREAIDAFERLRDG